MNKIKIMPDFDVSPIWVSINDGPFENANIDSFGLSESLKIKFKDWKERYDKIYNPIYPPDSKFFNKEDEMNFEKEGFIIWESLLKEKGEDYIILYYSVVENRLMENPDFRSKLIE